MIIITYSIELVVIGIIMYYLFKKINCRLYIAIPLYSFILLSSALLPLYLDIVYGFFINYFLIIAIFSIYYSYFRDKYLLIYGFTYLLLYFYICTIPYIVTNCVVYTLTCLYTSVSSIKLFEYFVFIIGLILLILLNTIVSQYNRLEYSLFHIVSIIYCLTHYAVLLRNIPNYLYIAVVIPLSIFTYFTSKYIGYILLPEEENIEIVFDKYISINTPVVFVTLAIFLIYSYLWG